MRGLLTALLIASGGCVVKVDFGNAAFACSDGICPAGQMCIANECRIAVGSDAAVSDSTIDSPASPDAFVPVNLVSNADMEGGLEDWGSFLGTLRVTVNMPHAGLQAIIVCKDDTMMDSTFNANHTLLTLPAEVPEGAHFTASIWVRASLQMTELAPASLRLRLKVSGGAMPDSLFDGPAVSPVTSGWVQLTTDAVVGEADRDLLALVVVPGLSPDATCFGIDDAFAARVP